MVGQPQLHRFRNSFATIPILNAKYNKVSG